MAHREEKLRRAVLRKRGTAGGSLRKSSRVVRWQPVYGREFQLAPFPVVRWRCWEHGRDVQGAPKWGAGKRTLDIPPVLPIIDRAGKGERTVNPRGSLTPRPAPPFSSLAVSVPETVSRFCPLPADRPPVCGLPPESPDCGFRGSPPVRAANCGFHRGASFAASIS